MNFDDNMTEVFDKYLNGQMTETEEREFLAQLNADPAMKQAYEFHRTIVAGIREARREELKDYIKQNAKIRYIGNIWGPKWVMASAAIVTLFLVSYVVIEYIVKPANEPMTAEQTDVDTSKYQDTNNAPVAEPNENSDLAMTDDGQNNYNGSNNTKPEIKKSVNVISAAKPNMDKGDWGKVGNVRNETIEVYYEAADSYSYKYNKTAITLYKVPFEDNVRLFKTEKAAYLGWNKKFYPLQADGEAHPLQEISDTSILKQLPTLK